MHPRSFQTRNRIRPWRGEKGLSRGPRHPPLTVAVLALAAILGACAPRWPGGIDVFLGWSVRGVRVVGIPPQSPAGEAGIRGDDYVIAIDGTPVAGKSNPEVQRMLSGEVGSFVTLRLRRGDEELEVRVRRVPYTKANRRWLEELRGSGGA